ncbi:MAG: peptidase S10, partial [Pseudomonadota bacterium]
MLHRVKRALFGTLASLLLCSVGVPAYADSHEKKDGAEESHSADASSDKPEHEKSVTTGSVTIAGKPIPYEATAGLMPMLDRDGDAKATYGYTYYRRTDITDTAKRPIMFAFNGGPGSASMWLHMGVLGPRRVVLDDPNHTGPAPYAHINNEYS